MSGLIDQPGARSGVLGTIGTSLSSQDLSGVNARTFTGITKSAKFIIVNLYGASLVSSSGSDILVQLGDKDGIDTSSYINSSCIVGSTTANVTNTSGFIIGVGSASRAFYGQMILSMIDTENRWLSSHNGSLTTTIAVVGGGQHKLDKTLTQLKITTASAANFDAGIASVIYY
jgi:hypothetical protein